MNRNAFRNLVKEKGFSKEEEKLIMIAYGLSKYAHRNQEREVVRGKPLTVDQKRYFNHPKRMAITMLKDGYKDYKTIVVALLHDTVEDTGNFSNQKTDGYYQAIEDAKFFLTRAFDAEVAEDVISLTLPNTDTLVEEFSTKNKCLAFYHNNLKEATHRAILAKLMDRIDNMQTIETKPPKVIELKIEETEGFYIPLFYSTFGNNPSDFSSIYGLKKITKLESILKAKKEYLKEVYSITDEI